MLEKKRKDPKAKSSADPKEVKKDKKLTKEDLKKIKGGLMKGDFCQFG